MAEYPHNWRELAEDCKRKAGYQCEECSAAENLTAAHVNHDPENPSPELKCLCWRCHRAYDAATGAKHPGRQARAAATRAKRAAERSKRLAVGPRSASLARMRQNIRNENVWQSG